MSYASVKLTHLVVVNLFLLIYVIKLILLLTRPALLVSFSRAVRVPEMITSLLFLLTGGYMVIEKPDISTLQVIKLALVFSSIPLAVIGFKKARKPLAILSVLMIVAAYGLAEMNKKAQSRKKEVTTDVNTTPGTEGYDALAHGALLYQKQLNCPSCHGDRGDAMIAGAPNLRLSAMGVEEIKTVIRNGRGMMPPYKDLSEDELEALAQFVKSLRD